MDTCDFALELGPNEVFQKAALSCFPHFGTDFAFIMPENVACGGNLLVFGAATFFMIICWIMLKMN